MSSNFIKVLFGILIFVLLAVFGYIGYTYLQDSKSATINQSGVFKSALISTPLPSRVQEIFRGKIGCLIRNDGTKDENGCALGLVMPDGDYYVLLGIKGGDFPNEDTNVEITGVRTTTDYPYRVKGAIQVTSIKKI